MIASTLLGTQPPVLPSRVLVSAAGLFGVSDSAARTALSRMVSSGELTVEDASYRLVGSLVDRQQRQERGRRAERRDWDGSWVLVIIPGGRRTPAERARQRTELVRARLGELREGVWGRPDNIAPVDLDLDLHRGRFQPEEPLPVQGLWDLDGWQARAEGLLPLVRALTGGLEAADPDLLARGFVVSAAVLRLFQRDPLLPDELLGEQWPGSRLRADYDRFDAAYRSLLKAWFAAQRPH